MSTSRENILKKIRSATSIPSELPRAAKEIDEQISKKLASITPSNPNDLLNQFKSELSALSADFHLINSLGEAAPIILKICTESKFDQLVYSDSPECTDVVKIVDESEQSITMLKATSLTYPGRKTKLAEIPVSLVKASFAVADIGSLVFPYDESKTTLPHFLADCVIAIVERKTLLTNQIEFFDKIDPEQAKNMVFVAGPSRTADIEKVLVLGAHGPRRLVVLMIDN